MYSVMSKFFHLILFNYSIKFHFLQRLLLIPNNTKGGNMKDSLLVGLAVGALAGPLYVSQNKKAQQVVEKGKRAIKKQMDKM